MTTSSPTITLTTQDHWSETEQRNARLVIEFVQLLMNDHDFDTIRARYGANGYLQHNRGIPDGIDGLVGYLAPFTKRYPEYGYDVQRVYADGEYVTLHSHVTLKAKHRGDERRGFNIIDTWRVVDGQITEHWDAIQPLSSSMRLLTLAIGGRSRNGNSLF